MKKDDDAPSGFSRSSDNKNFYVTKTYKKKNKNSDNFQRPTQKTYVKKEIIYDEKKLYNYGINRLSVREYGRKELFQKMIRFQQDSTIIDLVLDKLEKQSYLSDERRIKSLLHQFSSKESINKTKNRLLQKGFTKDQLDDVINVIVEPSIFDKIEDEEETDPEMKKAMSLLEKKYKTYNKDNWDKMVRFLASRGFKYDVISKSIKSFETINTL